MKYLPHEYTVREWHQAAGSEDAFVAMVERIRAYGYRERFGSRRILTYLRVDGWRYWTQGNPVDATTVINRCLVGTDGRPLKGPAWLRNPKPLEAQPALPGLER
jgi:hypothetical protein